MNVIHVSGKKKQAVARATLKPGSGIVRINNKAIETITPLLTRNKILEPLILAGDIAKKVNISVRVFGGGITGQADAVRLAIGRALAQFAPELKEKFEDYDYTLLVADIRRKETRKPNDSKARAKRQKSYR